MLKKRVHSTKSKLIEGDWLLTDATIWEMHSENNIKHISKDYQSEIKYSTEVTQEQILNSFADPTMISIWNLPKFIHQLKVSGFEARKHLRYFQAELARPLILLAMLLIGCAFTTTSTVRRSISVIIVLSLMSGFSLYSFDRLIASLADNNQVPIFISSVGPPLSGIFLALSILIYREESK